jgi:hypothetical protein
MYCFPEATTCFVFFFRGGCFAGQAYRKLVRHVKRAPKGHLGSLDSRGPGLSIWSCLVCVVWSSGIETVPQLYPFHSQVSISLQWCQRIRSFASTPSRASIWTLLFWFTHLLSFMWV